MADDDTEPKLCTGGAFAVPLEAGDEVLLRAKVIACAGQTHDLPRRDSGIVALEVVAYDAGRSFTPPVMKIVVPPEEVVAVTRRRPPER